MPYTEQRAYHREYYYKRRQKLLDYLGGACVICGSIDNLQFDHQNPEEKSFNISGNLVLSDFVKRELDKCQLLCEVHHREKTAQENSGYQHGMMYAWMKKKCVCQVCQASKQASKHITLKKMLLDGFSLVTLEDSMVDLRSMVIF